MFRFSKMQIAARVRLNALVAFGLTGHLALAFLLASRPALADCTGSGPVTCTGTTYNYDAGAGGLNATTITVQSSASVIGNNGIRAITVNPATSVALTNFGTIDGGVVLVGASNTFTNFGVLINTDPASLGLGYTINGNFEQKAGGSMSLRFDPGFFDQVFVLGLGSTATLDGKLILVPQAALYSTPLTYDFVAVIGGTVVGTFSSVISASPFFTVTADYSNGTTATFTLTPIAFNAVPGLTRNQQAAANALQANYTGTLSPNATTLYSNLFAATSVGVFDQLSGEGTAATQATAFASGTQFQSALLGQVQLWLSNPGSAGGAPLAYASAVKPGHPAFAAIRPVHAIPERQPWSAWASGFGGTQKIEADATPGAAQVSQRGAGGAMGVNYSVNSDQLFGVSVGGSSSSFSVPDRATSGDLMGIHLGAFGVQAWNAAYLATTLNYSRFDNDTQRTISGVGPTETAKGNFSSDLLAARLETGWRRSVGQVAVTPFAAVQAAQLWQRGYTETSTTAGGGVGVLGLSYAAVRATSLPVSLGAQADSKIDLGNGRALLPFARAAWMHEFKPARDIKASFVSVPSASFTAEGPRAAKNAAQVNAGAKLVLNRSAMLFASFNGEFSGRGHAYSGSGGVSMTW